MINIRRYENKKRKKKVDGKAVIDESGNFVYEETILRQDNISWKVRGRIDRPTEIDFGQKFARQNKGVMQPLCDDPLVKSKHNAEYNDGLNPITQLGGQYLLATSDPQTSLLAVSELNDKTGKSFAYSSVFRKVDPNKGQVNGAAASIDFLIKGIPCEQKAFTALLVSNSWRWDVNVDNQKVVAFKREQVRQALLQGVCYDTSVGMGGLTLMRWIQQGLPLLLFVQNGEYGCFVNLTRLWDLMKDVKRLDENGKEIEVKCKYALEKHINWYCRKIGVTEFEKLRVGFRWKPHRAPAKNPRTQLPKAVMEDGVQVTKRKGQQNIPDWVHPKLTVNLDEVPEDILRRCSSKAYTLSEVIDGKFHRTSTLASLIK